MFVTLEYETLIDKNYVFVDVRTEKEFMEETIPNAINIPLFPYEQYSILGTLYKTEGKEKAVTAGIDFVSSRLPHIYSEFKKLSNKKIAIFCARGGMRSTSIGSLLNSLGFEIVKINNGYKGYRKFVMTNLENLVDNFSFIALYGKTGCGKTEILNQLEKNGEKVVNLEGFANHRGSLLGGIGLLQQNSQKMFESLLFHKLYEFKEGTVFIEGESKRIGKIIIPECVYKKLLESKKILITADLGKRVEVIRNEYIKDGFDIEEIITALDKLATYIGQKNVDIYVNMLKSGQFDEVIEQLMINYYDNAYATKDKTFEATVEHVELEETCESIVNLCNEMELK